MILEFKRKPFGLSLRASSPASSSGLENPEGWLSDALGGQASSSGILVNQESAARLSAVYACQRILAESVSSLPLHVYRRLDPRGKERATSYGLYNLLHDQPNPEQTTMIWRETGMMHILGWGDAYNEIEWTNGGQVKAIWPLPPWRVTPRRTAAGMLVYEVWTGSVDALESLPPDARAKGSIILPAWRVLHIPGLGFNGIKGRSIISMATGAIGIGLAAEEYAGRFFQHGVSGRIFLEHPGLLGKEALERLKSDVAKGYQGLSNVFRAKILEEGMKANYVSTTPGDAQVLETRKYQLEEIARMHRIPLVLLGSGDKAPTYASHEQFMLSMIVHTLRPWLVRWEQEINRKLLPANGSFFCEHLVEAMMRGDSAAQSAFFASGRQWGYLSANDIREILNMNPLPGAEGDTYLSPGNMLPTKNLPAAGQPGGTQPDTGTPGTQAAFPILFADIISRVNRRQKADIMRAHEKGKFSEEWLDAYLAESAEFANRTAEPVLNAFGLSGGNGHEGLV
jgi:HK97 family phage portal protein